MLADLFTLIAYLAAFFLMATGAICLAYAVYSLRIKTFSRPMRVAYIVAGLFCWALAMAIMP